MASLASQRVLEYIESTFSQIIRDIQSRPCRNGTITLRRIIAIRPYHDQDDSMRLKWHVQDREISYSFPGKTADDAWRFEACLARILSEIRLAILQKVMVTKRDIFYRDPELFRQQATVDRYVDDIAHTCEIASPKGLVAGLSSTNLTDQPSIIQDGSAASTSYDLSHVKWMLVVEKEAVFNTLVEKQFHREAPIGPGVIITGKGYPDLATRRLLRSVADQCCPSVPLFGLFDNDPDGIRILKCYLYGSKTLAREQSCNLPELKWIGLQSDDVRSIVEAEGQIQAMSMRDRVAAISMLDSDEWRDDAGFVLPGLLACHTELQRMLWLNQKAEIQILDEQVEGLYGWLKNKLQLYHRGRP